LFSCDYGWYFFPSLFLVCFLILCFGRVGHAGSFSAEFTSTAFKSKIEETEEWKEYLALSNEEKKENAELIGKALLSAYVALDEDLRSLKECGIMVSTISFTF
jgi:hypothetical protein